MPIAYLTAPSDFPEMEEADESGVIAFMGELGPEWLLQAYSKGVFPWFSPEEPVVWWAPNPRMVLFPDNFKVSKSFRNILNRNTFQVSYNTAFSEVIKACALVPRLGQEGEWLTQDMQDAYIQMHELGWAHSVEVWQNNELVGGLYGIGFKGIFFGESMFSKVSNASKVALHNLCLRSHPLELKLIDCQVYTDHLASLGAEEIDRSIFKTYLPGLNPQKLKL